MPAAPRISLNEIRQLVEGGVDARLSSLLAPFVREEWRVTDVNDPARSFVTPYYDEVEEWVADFGCTVEKRTVLHLETDWTEET